MADAHCKTEGLFLASASDVGLVGRVGLVGLTRKIIPLIVVNLLYGTGINVHRDELSCHER